MDHDHFEQLLTRFQSLQHLSVGGVYYKDKNTIDLMDHFQLRSLELSNTFNDRYLPFCFYPNKQLRCLFLEQVKIDQEGVKNLFLSPCLTKLTIRGHGTLLHPNGLEHITKCQSLEYLDVSDASFWSAALPYICNMTCLRVLKGGAELSDMIMYVFNQDYPIANTIQGIHFENLMLAECIERMAMSQRNLSFLRIDKEVMTPALKMLSNTDLFPNLTSLELQYCGKSLTDDGAFYLLLSDKLTSLKMTSCTGVTDESVSLLRINHTLKTFTNDFNDGMRNWTISEVIQHNSTLTELSLCGDKISFNVEDLLVNQHLTHLKFCGDKSEAHQILSQCENIQHLEAPRYKCYYASTPSAYSPSPPHSSSTVSESPSYRSSSPT
ncbi:hypothetical protein AKO1_009931, partial [Acrasis kona]